MAKNLDNVNVLTDTFNAWMLRTNDIIDLIRTEVLTANNSGGVTGTPGATRNARLWGSFTANNLTADTLTAGLNFTANNSDIYIGPVRVLAGGSSGASGQVLTSTGSGVRWSSAAAGSGSVTNIASGNGISFSQSASASSITTTGTVNVRAGTGIVVNTNGVSVNTTYLDATLNPIQLQGATWASPPEIGTGTANTGTFTAVYIENDSVFSITSGEIRTGGTISAATPAASGSLYANSRPITTGAMKVLGNANNVAFIQVTANDGSTEWGHFKAHSNGYLLWSGSLNSTGTSPSEFPAGTRLLFQQNTAPVGWTMETNPSLNDRALRLVVGGGNFTNGYGNGASFSVAVGAEGTTGDTALTRGQMPAHKHGIGVIDAMTTTTMSGQGFFVAGGPGDVESIGRLPYYTGESWQTFQMGGNDIGDEGPVAALDVAKPHSHPLRINYVDVIIASKD